MRSIISGITVILAYIGVAFWTNDSDYKKVKSKQIVVDTSYLQAVIKKDSMEQELKCKYDETTEAVEANNKILQNKKKELLHLGVRVDSLFTMASLEDSNSHVLLPLN